MAVAAYGDHRGRIGGHGERRRIVGLAEGDEAAAERRQRLRLALGLGTRIAEVRERRKRLVALLIVRTRTPRSERASAQVTFALKREKR
jgi:hypothetical protein